MSYTLHLQGKEPEEDRMSCKNCPTGQYKDNTQHTTCQLCEAGSVTTEPGQSACTKCQPVCNLHTDLLNNILDSIYSLK